MTCLSPVLTITTPHLILSCSCILHFTDNQVADRDCQVKPGEVKQSWSKHDRGLGQQREWTQGTSFYLSSWGSQSCHTWGSTCQSVPFGEWLLIQGQITTLRQAVVTLKIIWHCGDKNWLWKDWCDTFLFKMKVMARYPDSHVTVFILRSCIDARICRRERCKLIRVFVCTQSGWLVINCACSLPTRADLSADYNNRSQCIKWGQWVQLCCMWSGKLKV